ncbi:MAG: response regulator transcription factor [Acidobacteria bacterium]|nr:response regulator transcription factor [Acidobacteriota bacterium]
MKASATAPGAVTAPHVLVVEDEPHMQMLLSDNLEFEGYRVTTVGTAEEALAWVDQHPCALMILDLMLPRMSGFELCRRVRAVGVRFPIIMLTARAEESDRVIGLDLGADDYLTKPFSIGELLARVRAHLRRVALSADAGDEVVLGEVTVRLRRRLVTRSDRRVKLSTREFELLRYLIAHRGEVVSREQLLRDVWGYSDQTVTRTIDNYIAKLRHHLEPRPHEPRYIVTVHGSGYQLLV